VLVVQHPADSTSLPERWLIAAVSKREVLAEGAMIALKTKRRRTTFLAPIGQLSLLALSAILAGSVLAFVF
jgi:hypothetical protein